MAHINWNTLQNYKHTHQYIHYLLKRYYEEETVLEEELVDALKGIKDSCASMIEDWKEYLGHENW